MTDALFTFNSLALVATVCLSSGVIIGAGLYAYISDSWVEREPKVDTDQLQRDLDEEFAPVSEAFRRAENMARMQ